MLKITRGDTSKFKFRRLDSDGEPIMVVAEQIYFSVKRGYSSTDTVIQKTIEDMTFDVDGYYHFTIDSTDTDGLSFGEYVFDIEVVIEQYKQTISKGPFILDKEVTCVNNEV